MLNNNTHAIWPLTTVSVQQNCETVVCQDKMMLMQGTKNLVAAAVQAKVKKFVLVTSVGADDPLYPLNLLFGVGCNPLLQALVS